MNGDEWVCECFVFVRWVDVVAVNSLIISTALMVWRYHDHDLVSVLSATSVV